MTDATALARQHSSRAIQALADVMDSDFSEPREVIAAANALLDRAHGKPTQAIVSGGTAGDIPEKLAAMSDTELLAALGEARMLRAQARPPIESTVETPPAAAKAQSLIALDRFHPLRTMGLEPEIGPAAPGEFPMADDPLAL